MCLFLRSAGICPANLYSKHFPLIVKKWLSDLGSTFRQNWTKCSGPLLFKFCQMIVDCPHWRLSAFSKSLGELEMSTGGPDLSPRFPERNSQKSGVCGLFSKGTVRGP